MSSTGENRNRAATPPRRSSSAGPAGAAGCSSDRSPGFAFIPAGAVQLLPQMPGKAAAKLLIALGRRMNGSGTCWPSHADLAKLTGLQRERTIVDGIQLLVGLGVLDVEYRKGRSPIYT